MKKAIFIVMMMATTSVFAQNITITTNQSNQTITGNNVTINGDLTLSNVIIEASGNFKVTGNSSFYDSDITVGGNGIFQADITFSNTCMQVEGNLVGGGTLTTDNTNESCLYIEGNTNIDVNEDQTLSTTDYEYVRDLPQGLPYVLYAITGQKVHQGLTGSRSYLNAGLANGVYIYTVNTPEIRFSKKIAF